MWHQKARAVQKAEMLVNPADPSVTPMRRIVDPWDWCRESAPTKAKSQDTNLAHYPFPRYRSEHDKLFENKNGVHFPVSDYEL